MLDDMRLRKLSAKTQSAYLRAASNFARHLERSPVAATVDDLRNYQLRLADSGTSPISLNAATIGLTFFFDVTRDWLEVMAKMRPVRLPQKLPPPVDSKRRAMARSRLGRLGAPHNPFRLLLGLLRSPLFLQGHAGLLLGFSLALSFFRHGGVSQWFRRKRKGTAPGRNRSNAESQRIAPEAGIQAQPSDLQRHEQEPGGLRPQVARQRTLPCFMAAHLLPWVMEKAPRP
jgi:hypothetical protein